MQKSLMKGPCFLWKKGKDGAIFNNHDDITDFLSVLA